MREELTAARITGPLGIIFKVMTIYQPGSLAERTTALKHLESPGEALDARGVAAALRKWRRWLLRTRTIGAQPPDASVLIKALTALCRKPLEGNPEVSFRVQLARSSLQVDVDPNSGKVDSLYGLLLAEMESLSHQPTGKAKYVGLAFAQVSHSADASGQDKGAPSPNNAKARSQTACRNFLTEKGCHRGAKCGFVHDVSSLTKQQRSERCFNCGSTQHRVVDCKAPKPEVSGKGGGKGAVPKGGAKQDGKANPMGVPKSPPPPPNAASLAASSSDKNREPAPELSPKAVNNTVATSSQDVRLQTMIAEAHQMLRDLQTGSQAQVGAQAGSSTGNRPNVATLLAVEGLPTLNEIEDREALLDSGASHALRPAKQSQESGKWTEVLLAGNQVHHLQQNEAGTLLTAEDSTQIILPLGALVQELGCDFKWTQKGLTLHHPKFGTIRVNVRNGCPQVAEANALKLIAELESKRLVKYEARIQELQARLDSIREDDWVAPLLRFTETGQRDQLLISVGRMPFLEEETRKAMWSLAETLEPTANAGWEYLKVLPVSRATRRRLLKRKWIVHLCAGPKVDSLQAAKNGFDPFFEFEGMGFEFLSLDILRSTSHNLLKQEGVWRLLLWAACRGKLAAVLAGPPCRTWSVLRYRPALDMISPSTGTWPQPVRSEHEPWGMTEMSGSDRNKVLGDNKLLLQPLLLMIISSFVQRRIIPFLEEHPSPASEYLPDTHPHAKAPSFWLTKTWLELSRQFGLRTIGFEQGALGAFTPKPTTIGTTLDLEHIRGLKDPRPTGSHQERVPSAVLAAWGLGFKQEIATAVKRSLGMGEQGGEKVSRVELENLDATIAQGLQRACEALSGPWEDSASDDERSYCASPSSGTPIAKVHEGERVSPQGGAPLQKLKGRGM